MGTGKDKIIVTIYKSKLLSDTECITQHEYVWNRIFSLYVRSWRRFTTRAPVCTLESEGKRRLIEAGMIGDRLCRWPFQFVILPLFTRPLPPLSHLSPSSTCATRWNGTRRGTVFERKITVSRSVSSLPISPFLRSTVVANEVRSDWERPSTNLTKVLTIFRQNLPPRLTILGPFLVSGNLSRA